jgi:class 3 adenylate cyclase
LQADGTLADIPVIMMSALDEIGAVARCLEKGASDYLTKPCDPVLLRARVRSTLQIRHLRDDLRHAEQRLNESAAAMQQLTRSIVPQPLAPSFAGGDPAAPIQYPEVSAVVVRFEGVDAVAARTPGETARLLTPAFEAFEQCSAESGLTLTRMTDRTFTAIAGAPQWSENHAQVAADLALRLREAFAAQSAARPQPLQLRIGVHTGLLTVGLAGDRRLVFGLWGDAVTTAEAIAACAPLGGIQLSNAACTKLGGRFELDSPLVIDVPGRGRLPTRALKARLDAPPAG